ncbi:MAG TPA: acyltransferase family protein [Ohtaekwangia sp.]|nr:acyltransferase family protein [Ohtaekwangia sp.]
MTAANRRYDIDAIRVIAIGLLLVYHVAIGFQQWGIMIGFIANDHPWSSLWVPMSMLNVWRIPLLFFVSGMGVYFAIQNRDWKGLMLERSGRILVPFVIGIFCIVPLHTYLWQYHYQFDLAYNPNPGHLWFLGNIFIYVLLLSPLFFFLKRNENGAFVQGIKKIFGSPWGLVLLMAAFVAEALLVNPNPFELYAMTWHGFFLGLLAFLFGFCFVFSGAGFWDMIRKWWWVFILAAAALFTYRLLQYQMRVPAYQLAIESNCWILSVLAVGYRYLNRPGKVLRYLSEAAYPIYIVHMIFLYLASMLIFPLSIPVQVQFFLVLLCTVSGCLIFYEFIIRRINFLRPLFGLKMKSRLSATAESKPSLTNP